MNPTHAPEQARRVLIVDDSRAIQAIIRRTLEAPELGPIHIQTANDGAEALDKVSAFKPDLVLSDWHMPGVSGIEMLQALRQIGHARLPVGFITTETSQDTLTEAQVNGAAFVLNKPFDEGMLKRMVANNLPPFKATENALPTIENFFDSAPAPLQIQPERERIKTPPALESMSLVQQVTFAHLGTRSYDLHRLPCEENPEFARQAPQLIALYASPGRKGAYAIAMLDLAACCLIGGMAAGLSASEILAMRESGRPSGHCVEHASRYMRAMGGMLKKHAVSDKPTMTAARLALQPFDKLQELFSRNQGRSDLHIRVVGMGEGHMSFLLV